MKKIYKIMVFILMLALAVGSAVIAPVTVFASASALIGATIILKNMPKTGTIGTPVELPKGSVTNGSSADAKVTVIGPNGKEVSVQDGKFTPTLIGDYKVVYTAEANGSHSKMLAVQKLLLILKRIHHIFFNQKQVKIQPLFCQIQP